MNVMPPVPLRSRGNSRFLLPQIMIVLLCAVPAAGQPYQWLVPAGGETWTAGTTHTLVWTSGPSSGAIQLVLAQTSPPYAATVLGSLLMNDGLFSWTLPSNLDPGTYQLNLSTPSFPPVSVYSGTITIQPAPECLFGCYLVSASLPVTDPPSGYCGASAHAAGDAAYQAVLAQLGASCFEGYAIEPEAVVIDVTVLPAGTCLEGSGGYIAEASGFACCCPSPVPGQETSWGTLKSFYR